MYPVNIQLKLSGTEQLKFLEEIISLLHVHQDSEGLESNLAMGVTPPTTHISQRYSPCVSEEEMESRWNASSNVVTALKDTTLSSFDATPQLLNHTSFEDGSSIFPHPPATHPPPSASSSAKFRRVIRPQPQKLVSQVRPTSEMGLTRETTQKHTDSIEFELRPQHYLNEAELALIRSQQPLSFSQSGNMHSFFVPKSSESDFKLGRRETSPLHRSEYWLKDTNEQHLQEWLLKKDRDWLLQRKKDLKRRQLERKKRAAKAAQVNEKAKQAKVAYQTWLDGKRAEDRRRRLTRKRSISVQPILQRNTALHSEIQPRPPNSAPPQSSIIRRPIKASNKQRPTVSAPLTNQENKTSKTISKRLTFKEWIQLKEKEKASKKAKDQGGGQLPEDLQKIARGVRKLRLQQKDYSKRHVDSGLPKHHLGCVDANTKSTKSTSSRRDPKQ